VDKVQIVHSAVRALPKDAQLIVVHKGLAKTARTMVPAAVVVTFAQFLNDPAFDKLVKAFVDGTEVVSTEA
jgi:mannitol-specific phosphotransferase system IIBC component